MIDMQCSWFPDLWIKDCCIAHDLGGGDYEFLTCVAETSLPYLGPFAGIFGIVIVMGMILGRPLRKLWLIMTQRR